MDHPPLGKLLIAVGILIYGDQWYGWRIMSAIFGAIGVAIMYWLAHAMTKSRPVALLASGLLMIDGLYFVESRTGVLDIFGTVFMLGAFAAFYYYLARRPTGSPAPPRARVLHGPGDRNQDGTRSTPPP